jgi:hypothetical protein
MHGLSVSNKKNTYGRAGKELLKGRGRERLAEYDGCIIEPLG